MPPAGGVATYRPPDCTHAPVCGVMTAKLGSPVNSSRLNAGAIECVHHFRRKLAIRR